MMKKLITITLFIASLQVFAQNTITIRSEVTGKEEEIDLPESMTLEMDTLLQDWHAKNFLTPVNDCQMSSVNPFYPDSVYIDRLSRIPTIMEMPYNGFVAIHARHKQIIRIRNKQSG